MDVLILLDKLDDLIYSSKPIPLTDQVRVEREEVYSLLDQIRVTLPEEIKQARWIVKERQEEQQEEQAEQAPSERSDDEHLKDIIDSIEELKRSQRPAPPPLTAAAAEKVRSIIEAAEASAAEMRAEAEREARRIEQDASRRSLEMRKRSAAEVEARLKRADEVTAALLAEAGQASANIEALVDRVRGPASALADVLGDGAGKVQSDFDRMSARMADAPVEVSRTTGAGARTADGDGATGGDAAANRRTRPGRSAGGVGQATEEWSYDEAIEDEAEGEPSGNDAFLPPEANVSAERIGEGGMSEGAGAGEPAAPGRRFEGSQHGAPTPR